MGKGKDRIKMTPIQVQMLVDIIYENSDLTSGNQHSRFSREQRNDKWEAVATLLNSKGLGPQKTAYQWRKSWHDLRCTIRNKASKIELAGGTELLNEKLSNLEKRVLQLIGDIAIENCPDKNGHKESDKVLSLNIEEELARTEEDLAKAMKRPNQIVLPTSVSRILNAPKGTIIQTLVAEENMPENISGECDVTVNVEHLQVNNDDCSNMDNNGSDDISHDDSSANNNEDFDIGEFLIPPPKRQKISRTENASPSSAESKSFISIFQRQIETQTAVLREQTAIMKDIAHSLRLIASSLHDSS